MRLLPRRLDPSFRVDASIQSFRLAVDLLVSLRLGVGDGRRSDSEGRAAGAGGSSGATEPSQRKCHADWSYTSRNEHARSRGSSMGVGVRRDTARSACWFRRISRGKRCCWEIHPPCECPAPPTLRERLAPLARECRTALVSPLPILPTSHPGNPAACPTRLLRSPGRMVA